MDAVLDAKKSTMDSLLRQMVTTYLPRGFNVVHGDDQDDESTFMSQILGNVTIEMVGALIGLPYFEILKQQYGDPSKVYPFQPGIAPVDDEIAKMKQYQEKYGKNRIAN